MCLDVPCPISPYRRGGLRSIQSNPSPANPSDPTYAALCSHTTSVERTSRQRTKEHVKPPTSYHAIPTRVPKPTSSPRTREISWPPLTCSLQPQPYTILSNRPKLSVAIPHNRQRKADSSYQKDKKRYGPSTPSARPRQPVKNKEQTFTLLGSERIQTPNIRATIQNGSIWF